MRCSDLTDGSFASTRHLTAPNAPKVASRAAVDTIPNHNLVTRVVQQVATLATIMAGTITVLVDTAGAITVVTTTMLRAGPLAMAQVVPAVMVSFCLLKTFLVVFAN